jgi:hypothetical protein
LPTPTLTFAIVLATLLGALFHLVSGGDGRRMILYLLSAWVGFALGHIVGVVFEIDLFNVGTLRAASAALGALVALVAARFLGRTRRPAP